jgi:hypothetical protein
MSVPPESSYPDNVVSLYSRCRKCGHEVRPGEWVIQSGSGLYKGWLTPLPLVVSHWHEDHFPWDSISEDELGLDWTCGKCGRGIALDEEVWYAMFGLLPDAPHQILERREREWVVRCSQCRELK